jgi:hypothetical protein
VVGIVALPLALASSSNRWTTLDDALDRVATQ